MTEPLTILNVTDRIDAAIEGDTSVLDLLLLTREIVAQSIIADSRVGDLITMAITKGAADRVALADLELIAAKLRETAAALDDGTMSKPHAANRLRKMARGIDGGK